MFLIHLRGCVSSNFAPYLVEIIPTHRSSCSISLLLYDKRFLYLPLKATNHPSISQCIIICTIILQLWRLFYCIPFYDQGSFCLGLKLLNLTTIAMFKWSKFSNHKKINSLFYKIILFNELTECF